MSPATITSDTVGSDATTALPWATTALLSPFQLGPVPLRNRAAMASMTRVSATADGLATKRMVAYYGEFARGGFGLVITDGIYTDKAFAQGYLHQPGLTDAAIAGPARAAEKGMGLEGVPS